MKIMKHIKTIEERIFFYDGGKIVTPDWDHELDRTCSNHKGDIYSRGLWYL